MAYQPVYQARSFQREMGDDTPMNSVHEPDEEYSDHCCMAFCRTTEDEHTQMLGDVHHHCTDPICCGLAIFAIWGYISLLLYARDNGDMRRITHGYNFLGELCGVGAQESAGYLYYCPKATNASTLDFKHPICRASCPTSDINVSACYAGSVVSNRSNVLPIPNITDMATKSYAVNTSFFFTNRKDYNTTPLMDRYCFPDPKTKNGLYAELQKELASTPFFSLFMKLASLKHTWHLLLIAAGVAVILSFVYLLLLKTFTSCLVWTSLVTFIVACLSIGTYIIVSSTQGGDGLDGLPSTGDSKWDIVIGAVILVIGLGFLLFVCCACNAIAIAIGVVEAACECIWEMKCLLLEPVITLTLKGASFVTMMAGFILLLSCGQRSTMSLEQFETVQDYSTGMPSGVMRSFTYDDGQRRMIAAYVFLIYWALEYYTALGQYVLAFAVGKWYFTPNDPQQPGVKQHDQIPSCLLLKGYLTAMIWHTGTLAFGSFLIAVFRFIILILNLISRQVGGGNKAAACVLACCTCVLDCFKRTLEYINKTAYIDVAVNSNDYIHAAWQVFKFFADAGGAIPALKGACCIFTVAGVGSVSSACAYLIFCLLRRNQDYTDITSHDYVADPVVVTVAAALVAAIVSSGFMMVFDNVADTLLYCFVLERRPASAERLKAHGDEYGQDVEFAPGSLHRLLEAGE